MTLSWIVNQATDGMRATDLETLHRILSDIAINAELALESLAEAGQ